jgi:hypothetical protein
MIMVLMRHEHRVESRVRQSERRHAGRRVLHVETCVDENPHAARHDEHRVSPTAAPQHAEFHDDSEFRRGAWCGRTPPASRTGERIPTR